MNTAASAERQEIEPLTKFAIIMAMVSFVTPFVFSVVAFVVGAFAKSRLRRTGGDRMNEGLNTIAQLTGVFTAVLYGGFLWYAQIRWG